MGGWAVWPEGFCAGKLNVLMCPCLASNFKIRRGKGTPGRATHCFCTNCHGVDPALMHTCNGLCAHRLAPQVHALGLLRTTLHGTCSTMQLQAHGSAYLQNPETTPPNLQYEMPAASLGDGMRCWG